MLINIYYLDLIIKLISCNVDATTEWHIDGNKLIMAYKSNKPILNT